MISKDDRPPKTGSYEVLILNAGFFHDRYEKATKERNAEELKQIKLGAAKLLQQVGVNL